MAHRPTTISIIANILLRLIVNYKINYVNLIIKNDKYLFVNYRIDSI